MREISGLGLEFELALIFFLFDFILTATGGFATCVDGAHDCRFLGVYLLGNFIGNITKISSFFILFTKITINFSITKNTLFS